MNSLILNSDTLQNALKSLIGFENKKFVLIYRGSRDGFRGYNFHTHCNGVNDTLTVVKTVDGNIMGGFAAKDWTSENIYVYDPQAFIYSLVNPYNSPVKNGPITASSANQLYTGETYGPTWGNHDLHIADNCNQITNSYVESNSFTSPAQGTRQTVYSARNFLVAEIEVYATISVDQ